MSTIEIKGGKATLSEDPSALTARKRRPVELLQAQMGRKLHLITKATRLFVDGEVVEDRSEVEEDGKKVYDGGDFHITELEFEKLSRYSDALAWALLESWTLDQELPASPAELLDLPVGIFDPIRNEAARIFAGTPAKDDFSVAAVEDTASPTGA